MTIRLSSYGSKASDLAWPTAVQCMAAAAGCGHVCQPAACTIGARSTMALDACCMQHHMHFCNHSWQLWRRKPLEVVLALYLMGKQMYVFSDFAAGSGAGKR